MTYFTNSNVCANLNLQSSKNRTNFVENPKCTGHIWDFRQIIILDISIMKIEINEYSFLIGVILFIGYIAMFISLMTQPLQSPQDSLRGGESNLLFQLETSKSLLLDKTNEINLLEKKLIASESSKNIVPSTLTSAYRPGVIILGMHRSGTSALGKLASN